MDINMTKKPNYQKLILEELREIRLLMARSMPSQGVDLTEQSNSTPPISPGDSSGDLRARSEYKAVIPDELKKVATEEIKVEDLGL